MRIVWTQSPVTSTTIIKALEGVTGWMPTTVKTLLSRLVNKGILEFEAKGRTFYYAPLLTEVQCIQEEMKNMIEKVYGGTLNYETTHFRFKGHQDEPYVKKLANALESKFTQITDDLQQSLDEALLVYTHASQSRLHSALGLLDGPKWLRAGYLWGILHMAPQTCFDDLSAEDAAVHTFTQLIIQKINPMTPYWLQQAVAAYESQWLTKERIINAVSELVAHKSQSKTHAFIQMQVMSDAFLSFKELKGYEMGYTVTEFIVVTYGMDKLAAFIRLPHDFESVFGLEEREFWDKWRVFLIKNYQ